MAVSPFARRYRQVAFWIVFGLILAACTAILLPFIPALLWALVLSVLMYPLYRRFLARFSKWKLLAGDRAATVASLTTVTLTLFIILIPLFLVGVGLFAQVGSVTTALAGETGKPSFDSALRQLDASIKPFTDSVVGDFSIREYVMAHQSEIAQSLRAPVAKLAGQAAFTILTIVIALLSMFFMLRDGEKLKGPALELVPLKPIQTEAILSRITETIHAVFVGTVLVALIQGAIMGIAFAVAGVPSALMLGVATAVFGVIPLLGPPIIYIPVGLMLLAQGNNTGAAIVLAAGFLIASQVDNLLKPFLIGGRVNLHPLAIFFSILGGVFLIGPIGIMAGPMLLTILLAFIEAVRAWMSEPPDEEPTSEGSSGLADASS